MSANNKLLIYKGKSRVIHNESAYLIDNVDVDGGGGFKVGEGRTLEEAIKVANNYMEEEVVEYGLDIIV